MKFKVQTVYSTQTLGSIVIYFTASWIFLSACQTKRLARSSAMQNTPPAIQADTFSILSSAKLELTKQYCEENYGARTYRLRTPQMIVVHYTVIPSLDRTLQYFKRDSIERSRSIQQFSPLNVGIHYVVDRDGRIYTLLPDSIVARHVIGFNHVALGIENIAKDSSDLTDLQVKSNIALIRFLKHRHHSIRYLIGHEEYNRPDLPHYKLFRAVNEKYVPHDKADPGPWFMKKIRRGLSAYGMEFEQ